MHTKVAVTVYTYTNYIPCSRVGKPYSCRPCNPVMCATEVSGAAEVLYVYSARSLAFLLCAPVKLWAAGMLCLRSKEGL